MPLTLKAGALEDLKRWLEDKTGPALLITRNNLRLADAIARSGPGVEWIVLTKTDLKDSSPRRLLSTLRSEKREALVIEDGAVDVGRRFDLYRAMLLSGRARSRWLLATDEDRVLGLRVRWTTLPGLLAGALADAVATARALLHARGLVRSLRKKTRLPGTAAVSPRVGALGPSGSSNATAGSSGRVAYLKTDFWFGVKAGGSVSHALGVLDGMRRFRLEPRVWTSSLISSAPAWVQQTEIPPPSRPAFIEEAAMAGFNRVFVDRVARDLIEFRPSVIYQRHAVFSLAGLALAHKLGLPLLLEINNSEVWARKAWSRLRFESVARDMERTAFAKADRLLLVSEELIPTVLALGGEEKRIVVNPNGVDVERFDPLANGADLRRELGLSAETVVCGFVGTFTRWHGVLFLAEQAAVVAREHPNIFFLFIGDGDLRPQAQRVLEAAGGASRALFTGFLAPQHIPRYLAACDIMLSPHLPFEDGTPFFGSPTKIFEYMAAGRSIVASRQGQIGRVIEDGRNGLLFTPGDGAGFRSALLQLASDRGARQQMGREARALAESRYTWVANVRRALEGIVPLPEPGATA
jgi:glycosyltransferase involved in cell wall biosynthesis